VPATQVAAEHVAWLAAADVPTAHGVGAVAPRAQEWPAGHAVHVADAAPPREKEPAGHCAVHVAIRRLVVEP
jgi:hypothetical protein